MTSSPELWDWWRPARGRANRVRPQPAAIWGRSDRARIQAALGTPEVVVKVISYQRSVGELKRLAAYLTREAELDVVLKDGSRLKRKEGLAGSDAVIEAWATSFSTRKNARNAAHLMLSAPAGSDPKRVLKGAEAWAAHVFGAGRDYGLVLHTDTDKPHVHLILVRDGPESEPLRFSRDHLQALREAAARALGEHGISVNATPRSMRGKTERAEDMAIRKIRARDGVCRVDVEAARQVLETLQENRFQVEKSEKPLRGHSQPERSQYRRAISKLEMSSTREGHMRRIAVEQRVLDSVPATSAPAFLAKLYRADREDRERIDQRRRGTKERGYSNESGIGGKD